MLDTTTEQAAVAYDIPQTRTADNTDQNKTAEADQKRTAQEPYCNIADVYRSPFLDPPTRLQPLATRPFQA